MNHHVSSSSQPGAARSRYVPPGRPAGEELSQLAARHAKTEFLSVVSHELRTPMNGVLGMIELVLGGELAPDQREQLTMAREAACALQAVLSDLVDFSRVEDGRFTLDCVEFDPADVLSQLLQLQRSKALEKGIGLTLQLDPGLPPRVWGDPTRWRQVVINLIGNALKFTAEGSVHVVLRPLPPPRAGACRLEVSVTDTGPGIPQEQRALVFEPFMQLDSSATRRHGGLGLGLALSRHLAELMGGSLWLETELGQGSTFGFIATFETAPRPDTASPFVPPA